MGSDPAARIGDITKYFQFSIRSDETVAGRLAACGVDPAGLHGLVLTHLHYDHAGGSALISPSVDLYIQEREWVAGHEAEQIVRNFYIPDD
jgi:N-acyl homoserine lactone hydrolase